MQVSYSYRNDLEKGRPKEEICDQAMRTAARYQNVESRSSRVRQSLESTVPGSFSELEVRRFIRPSDYASDFPSLAGIQSRDARCNDNLRGRPHLWARILGGSLSPRWRWLASSRPVTPRMMPGRQIPSGSTVGPPRTPGLSMTSAQSTRKQSRANNYPVHDIESDLDAVDRGRSTCYSQTDASWGYSSIEAFGLEDSTDSTTSSEPA